MLQQINTTATSFFSLAITGAKTGANKTLSRFSGKRRSPSARLCFLVLTLFALALKAPFAVADSQPPSIVNGIFTSAISETSIRVTWNRPWDDSGIAGYNVYRDGSYYDTVRETNYIDRNARPGTLHDYQITAFDFSANYSALSAIASAQASGVAPPAPQNDQSNNSNAGADRPDRPSNLSANVLNGNQIRLTWQTPNSPRRVTGYNIYRDGSYITWVGGNEYNESWIEWGRDYRYTVVAIDEQVKFSDPSDPLVVNTANGDVSNQNSNQAQTTQPQAEAASPASNSNSSTSSVPDGYRLVFAEEFQSGGLDGNKWNTSYRWGSTWIINSEKQFYVDQLTNPWFGYQPFSFDGEFMYINAIRTPDHLRGNAVNQPYLSGAMTTYNKFTMKYGYVEMRAKLPAGRGLWSAFWLLHHHDHLNRPEIDVVEYIGHQRSQVYQTYHWVDGWAARRTPSFETHGPDYSQDFHTYAVRWEPGTIIWYVDGVEQNRFDDGNVSNEEMYLLVNLAVGGWWPGDPDGSTQFPATMAVDYIRAYQR